MSVTLASLAGLKINDTVSYNQKLSRFKKVNLEFTKNAPDFVKKDYYLPEWDNNRLWNKSYDRLISGTAFTEGQKGFHKSKWPTMERYKNYCYSSAESGIKGNLEESCHTNISWCSDCLRDNSWST